MDPLQQFPHLSPEMQQLILDQPAMPPPNGSLPNFDHPANRNVMSIVVSSILLFLGTMTFVFRLYSRLFLVKRLKLEDYLGMLAFLAYVGEAVTLYFHATHCGFFVHQWDMQLRTVLTCSKNTFAFPLTYTLVMMFAKPAILMEWVRIFVPKPTRGWFYWLAFSMAGVYVTFYFISFLLQLLSCLPIEHSWKPWIPAKCINVKSVDISAAYVNLAIDLLILILPQTVIWRLHLSLEKKAGVAVIFSIGILTLVCAAGRVVSNTRLPYPGEGDTMYGLADVFLWAFAESTCILLVLCVPAMPKVFMETTLGQSMVSPVRNLISSLSSLFQSSRRSFSTDNELQETSATKRKPSHTSDEAGSSQVHLTHAAVGEQGHCEQAGKGILRRIDIESHAEVGSVPLEPYTIPVYRE